MYSVTKRIKEIRQPRLGYLPVSEFEVVHLEDDSFITNFSENLSPSVVGTVVDYLTRFMFNRNATKAFEISLMGAERAGKIDTAKELVETIKGLDEKSIRAACTLASYDVFYRSPIDAYNATIQEPNRQTITNIKTMVRRAVSVFEKDGSVQMEGITFEDGYSEIVTAGDADFATSNTLWDMKVTRKENPDSKETLQLLIYYIMGCHSIHKDFFGRLSYIAFFNPRRNTIHRCAVNKISQELIKQIEDNVICYGKSWTEVLNEAHDRLYIKVKNGEWLDTYEVAELVRQPKQLVLWLVKNGFVHPKKRRSAYIYDPQEIIKLCDEDKKHITVDEWHRIGRSLYGPNQANWKFRCPICGKVAEIRDFQRSNDDVRGIYDACHKCKSWFDPYIWHNDTSCRYQYIDNEVNKTELAYGGIVIVEGNGKIHHAFEFADECVYNEIVEQ